MGSITILAFLSVFIPATCVLASESKAEVVRWFTYYYQNPEPDNVPEALKFAGKAGLLDDKKAVPPMVGFLAGVIRNNPEEVNGWMDALKPLEEPIFGVVVLGLWYADLPDSKKQAYSILDQHPKLKDQYKFLYQGSPMAVDRIPLEQGPWVLDLLWGNFMATGDKAPVVRIISALGWIDVKGDTNRLLVAGAAKWSLTSNAVQHRRVMEILQEELGKQPEEIAGQLRNILDKAKVKRKEKWKGKAGPLLTLLS
jgi:hypothetical protein